MKKALLLCTGIAGLAWLAMATPSFAAEPGAAQEKTITGEGKCGKCALKETEKCQNVIQVSEGSKKTTYYLVQNDISKEFHENLCKAAKKVKATGTVKEVDGKNEFTATKIELVGAEK